MNQFRSFNRHGLAHKSTEQRKSGDRKATDHCQPEGNGHIFIQSAQLVEFSCSDNHQGAAHAHIKQRLINNMAKGMRGGAVKGHGGSDSDTGNHVTDL